jgi:hypothetical protein
MTYKVCFSFLWILLALNSGFCQGRKTLMKSWIKREIYDLSKNQRVDDTTYIRYTFSKNVVYICFSPGWNDNQHPWNLSGNQLTIGISTYTVENLTDSTLTIFIPGFRRIILDDEEYLTRKAENLQVVDQLNGEPVYQATKYVTPRFKVENFRRTIEQNLEGYNIRKATIFIASFIVKKDGTVDKVQVIEGITSGFDAEVCKQLIKTSKKWKPAVYNGQPVQTQMTYTIKYLDSIVK